MIYEFSEHQEALKESTSKQEAHSKETKATKSQLISLKKQFKEREHSFDSLRFIFLRNILSLTNQWTVLVME